MKPTPAPPAGTFPTNQLVDEREKADAEVQKREVREQTRRIAPREALCPLIPFNEEKANSREELWSALPDDLRVNVMRFEAVLEEGVGKQWMKKGGTARLPALYRRNRNRSGS